MSIWCRLGLHDWYIRGWFGKKSPTILREGRIRYCRRCPKEQKYDGEEWQEVDSGMIARERYRS